MAYNKKNWQDNVSDITAAELNRMEQGIYDNSLVADAVTNTLNPTDTETYKTAELTEGQITDVIGVSDILIKGQTSQNGEPTPDSPVDVNVVSGSNVVDIQNSDTNFAKEPVLINYNVNSDGLGTSNGYAVSQKIFVNNETKFYYGLNTAFSNVNDSTLRIGFFDENDNFLSRVLGANIATSPIRNVTIPNNTKYIMIGASNNASNGFWREIEKVYYGFSSTIVPHQGKELPLDLPVENLFDVKKITENTAITDSGQTATSSVSNLSNYIKVKKSTSYTLTYEYSTLLNQSQRNVCFYNDRKEFIESIRYTPTNKTNTILTPINGTYLRFSYDKNCTDIKLQETNSQTDPIELCKIGNYQDYFYRDNNKGKWYLHKEVGKYTLDGTNNAIIGKSGTTNNNLFISSVISDILMPTNNNESINVYCSHFIGGKSANYLFLNNTLGIAVRTTKDLSIGVTLENTNNTIALINTWLASNNVITYYPLATATDTEITGTLKEQLEAIYNAPLYEETNITQKNNDLPMVLDITACKDNINGIKAFIRK